MRLRNAVTSPRCAAPSAPPATAMLATSTHGHAGDPPPPPRVPEEAGAAAGCWPGATAGALAVGWAAAVCWSFGRSGAGGEYAGAAPPVDPAEPVVAGPLAPAPGPPLPVAPGTVTPEPLS